MTTCFSHFGAFSLMCFGVCISISPALASAECARYGRPSYTAERTVEIAGHTIQSKVIITPQYEREELTINGRAEIRLVSPGRIISYNLEDNTGIAQTAPPPPRPAKDKVRIREQDQNGAKVVSIELVDDKGAWNEIARSTCRNDGVLLEKTFAIPQRGGGGIQMGHMTQNVISMGPPDPNLFKVPAQVRIKR